MNQVQLVTKTCKGDPYLEVAKTSYILDLPLEETWIKQVSQDHNLNEVTRRRCCDLACALYLEELGTSRELCGSLMAGRDSELWHFNCF